MLPNDDLSFQLFSARAFPVLEEKIWTLANAGYTDVQPYFNADHAINPTIDVAALKRLTASHGLSIKSAHFDISLIEKRTELVTAICDRLGAALVVAPWLEPSDRPVDAAGWSRMADRLSAISELLASNGLEFSWHNHDFEFVRLPDGQYPMDILMASGITWEPDLAWITLAEQDPTHWLRRYAGRLSALHVKDIAHPGNGLDEGGFAALGEGSMPWDHLWPVAVEAGIRLAVIEHDNPKDYRHVAYRGATTLRALASTK
ncbi:AP endonuclease [Devosia yakushimensis]|uniref:AP endonuclease n=1 Tax=Devosia yakushimensis TaxID=470028 RepID=A0ABQ5UJ17_9HYPH|nr:sugar phosphate isomerase/epimerase [Devosia yakushimensis]GLQ12090.1 AP endonuclease [Devosia yakushimensis]